MIKKQDIFKLCVSEFKEIDLRYFFIKLRENILSNVDVYVDLKKIVMETMLKGLNLILNFDDCCLKYEELFDPDIKEFYGNQMLSHSMWKPKFFSQTKCWQAHLKTKTTEAKLDKNFKFLVYSKYVIEPDLQEHDLINVIEKRFEKCFPLVNMNVLILSKFQK